jgi:hypothetical protein
MRKKSEAGDTLNSMIRIIGVPKDWWCWTAGAAGHRNGRDETSVRRSRSTRFGTDYWSRIVAVAKPGGKQHPRNQEWYKARDVFSGKISSKEALGLLVYCGE